MRPALPPEAITCFAPAKINLALHVVGRRADGYHLLDSLVAFADCGDQITVERSAVDSFAVAGRYGRDVPTDASNLVLRARDALRHRAGASAFPVRIHLEKNLPIASGIGGGSSDAAATLKALCKLWQVEITPADLSSLGLSLGADVPMCLLAQPARIRGIGEQVEPVTSLPLLPAVLVNPGVAVSTPTIFKQLRSPNNPPLDDCPSEGRLPAWFEWLEATRNDLQQPAVEAAPVIADVLTALTSVNAAFARMSGSGATCFGLFASPEAASEAAAQLARQHPQWYVQTTILAGSEHKA